jgi:NTE family protein
MSAKRALVLTGGGARGAYQVGVLKYIAEHIEDPEFKILVGSSAGAINISAYASHDGNFKDSVANMERLWSSLKIQDVLKIGFLSLLKTAILWPISILQSGVSGRPLISSLIDTTPLRALIFKFFSPTNIKSSLESGRFETLAIIATEVSSASSVTFVQSKLPFKAWTRSKRRSESTRITHKHILASSAIPLLFKSIRINRRQYLDGSIRSTTPLSPAARLGATEIFSIGVRKNLSSVEQNLELATRSRQPENEPTVSQIGGLILNSIFSDSLDSDAEHLKRINRLLEHVDKKAANDAVGMKQIEVCLVRPSEDLGSVAKNFTYRLPPFLRFMMRSLGSEQSKSNDIASYLLFDAEYAKYLINLGYKDASEQRENVLAFFRR